MKSLAGWASVICRVEEFTALRPEIVCEFWNAAMLAAVCACDLTLKYAASASEYWLSLLIVLVKYSALPTGLTGLKNALNSRMKSSAVTCRAGLLFHITPGLMWKV